VSINWFIFSAQIINFLILVAVLQRFLYRPIIRAMDRREKTIRDRLETAERSQQEAKQEAEHNRQLQQEFTDRQTAMLAQAKAEVEQTRQTLLQAARAEVEATQARWQTSIQQQKDSFLLELRHQAVQQIEQTARHALLDLANVELEQQIMSTFLQRLSNLAGEDQQLLQNLVVSKQEAIAIYSTFEIPAAERQALLQTLQQQLSTPAKLQFEIKPDLLCGIELRAAGSKLSWSIESYLEALEATLAAVFDEETDSKHEPGGSHEPEDSDQPGNNDKPG
jgi:F-type H+-transporting ATPase subunit b